MTIHHTDFSRLPTVRAKCDTPLIIAVERAGHGLLYARIGTKWDVKKLPLVLGNITNMKARLGDVNPLTYPQTNPVTGLPDPRAAAHRPFQVALEFPYGK
jgi:hypothetical protein